ncbi:endonuclease/exonuclease/phosphatase family protein [Aeoliella sp.]|uniref:endonuclease/exonuclease/phosphatase family protein n=1 Tax=Aeoliella sp. TaxID=2795800 RepID=UPI003CCB8AA3
MRLAVYNVENLFNRAKVMNRQDWGIGRQILAQFAELNSLLGEANYTANRKRRMVRLLTALGLGRSDRGPAVILRRNRGGLVKRPRNADPEIIADGRADWVGSLELVEAPIDHESMLMTARVIRDVDADILAMVEAESRPALQMFNQEIVTAVGGREYECVMLIDGNDSRGIDVGIAVKDPCSIGLMRSHVHDMPSRGEPPIFSRDCPEYFVSTDSGVDILVMINHFKSKGYGTQAANNARRKSQAERVREIYRERMREGFEYIAIVGDFNDTPDSSPLRPLHYRFSAKDVFEHPDFDDGGYPGTYGSCRATNKIDYLLLSPRLYAAVRRGGVWRKGMWAGVRPVRWDTYEELNREVHAGSDHACLWVDLEL